MNSERSPLDELVHTVKTVDRLPTTVRDAMWSSLQSSVAAQGVVAAWGAKAVVASSAKKTALKLVLGLTLATGGGTAIAIGRHAGTTSQTDVLARPPKGSLPAIRAEAHGAKPSPPPRTVVEPNPPIPIESRLMQQVVERPREAGDLVQQAQLLGHAWTATERGQLQEALHHLDEHQARFPDSPLDLERQACRIVVHCMRGDERAVEHGEAFLSAHGSGVHAIRIQHACIASTRKQ